MRWDPARWNRSLALLDPRRLRLQRAVPRVLVVTALREAGERLSDRELERRFGSPVGQRMLLEGLASSYREDRAEGFSGALEFELTRPATGGEPSLWTIEVEPGRARARPGQALAGREGAELSLRISVADFVRVAGGTIDPVEPVLAGRARMSGDLRVAARLAEMFGAPQQR